MQEFAMSIIGDNPYASPSAESMLNSPTGDAPLASRSERFLGALVDGLIIIPVAFVGGMILGVALVMAGIETESRRFQVTASLVGTVMGGIIFLLINGYFLSTRGQTVGKMVLKTRIVAENGSLVPLGPLILKRYLPIWALSALPLIGSLLLLGNSLAIFRSSRKCIHDDLAGTKVVKAR
jgi:uncharacterized RDD family membrane protein YckC